MIKRRDFNKALGGLITSATMLGCGQTESTNAPKKVNGVPLIISTWNNQEANKIAFAHLDKAPDDILTAIEKGINLVEANPEDTTVGFGGYPDRDGNVTLDACIMDKNGNAGSVTYLQGIKHPISVARKVMEVTPHVILSGKGAQSFALDQGFKIEDLLTVKSKKAYAEWLVKEEYSPKINVERHDTIGMIGVDSGNNLSGGCSTSGLSFKMSGRVGDSPIIGAGLFVDNEIGACVATGLGELVLKTCSTFLAVEFMRSGLSPQKACESAIKRIISKTNTNEAQVGLIALNKNGDYGAYSIHTGFNFSISDRNGTRKIESDSYNE